MSAHSGSSALALRRYLTRYVPRSLFGRAALARQSLLSNANPLTLGFALGLDEGNDCFIYNLIDFFSSIWTISVSFTTIRTSP